MLSRTQKARGTNSAMPTGLCASELFFTKQHGDCLSEDVQSFAQRLFTDRDRGKHENNVVPVPRRLDYETAFKCPVRNDGCCRGLTELEPPAHALAAHPEMLARKPRWNGQQFAREQLATLHDVAHQRIVPLR